LCFLTFLLVSCEDNSVELVQKSKIKGKDYESRSDAQLTYEGTELGGEYTGSGGGGGGYTDHFRTGIWSSDFPSGINREDLPVAISDINNDNKGDIIFYGNKNVLIALSDGYTKFNNPFVGVINDYGISKGLTNNHKRTAGDVNGDGFADLVIFDNNQVLVAENLGFDSNGNFNGFLNGWDWSNEFRVIGNGFNKNSFFLGDVNGDNKDDVIGLKDNKAYVGISTGIGGVLAGDSDKGFKQSTIWSNDFHNGLNGDDSISMGDVNGDGYDDLIISASGKIWVSISNGINGFLPKSLWASNEFINWNSNYPRMVSDVNDDGYADMIGYGDFDVWVLLSNGMNFGPGQIWYNGYGFGGYSIGLFPRNKWQKHHWRFVNDVTGDGKGDIIGFGTNDVWVTTSKF
jgi:hypothetical protein